MPTTPLGFVYPADSDYASSGADVPRAVQEGLESVDTYLTNFLGGLEGQYMLTSLVTINNPTTSYSPTAGTDALYVECVGGGGGGGGAATGATNATGGGGGGGGGYAGKFLVGPLKASYTVAVGTGGTGVSAGTGNSGGTTSFDSPAVCSASGGSGGTAGAVGGAQKMGGGGGDGGSLVTGDFAVKGSVGGYGIAIAAAECASGAGGDSFYGSGASPLISTNGTGAFATTPGGGGGGGAIISGGANRAGGSGANGVIRVWEYKAVDPA